MAEAYEFPSPPKFSEEELALSKRTGDYKPLLFEWYKFVGALGHMLLCLQPDSPACRQIPHRNYHVLIGLLNRCFRLMLSNVALSHEGKFGETTAIVDRCIIESSVTISWLCRNSSKNELTRYIANGLKTELEFQALINANVAANGGTPTRLEARMLNSITRHISAAGLDEEQIRNARGFRAFAGLVNGIGLDRLFYVTTQRMGSHHVHGTWPSLLMHYLEESPGDGGLFVPRDHDCSTHINQYMFVSVVVLRALADFVAYFWTMTVLRFYAACTSRPRARLWNCTMKLAKTPNNEAVNA